MKLVNIKPLFEAKGTNFNVTDLGNGYVKKQPIKGGNIPEIEYTKLDFMKSNFNTGVFAKITELTKQYAIVEKVDTDKATRIVKVFIDGYVSIWGEEDFEKYGEFDNDAISDFIMNEVLSPRSTIDWDNIHDVVYNQKIDDKAFRIGASWLLPFRTKLMKIQNWPVSVFDIHIDNIGVTNRGLVIFDF
jgi:hypothetical protein